MSGTGLSLRVVPLETRHCSANRRRLSRFGVASSIILAIHAICMCSLTFPWSVCPLSRPLIANTHVQLDKQEVSKGWISREAESIFITLYLTLIKICYCPFKESCSEIMIKNKHTHSFPDFILSMTCLGCYVYGACTRLKAEDINHKKLTFWFAIMHALQPVGQIIFSFAR